MRRQRDDRHSLQIIRVFILSRDTRSFYTTHERHTDIHKDDIIVVLLDSLDCQSAILDNRNAVPGRLEELERDFLIDHVCRVNGLA